ncbi:hypothetical protein C8R45DRAFT_427911 [Mycena sanguinolenta]|nr:hypothetical protein C8R45DRAFT_427911 [Mycena sanguinolenta]
MHIFSATYFFCFMIMVVSASPIPTRATLNFSSLSDTKPGEAPISRSRDTTSSHGSNSASVSTPPRAIGAHDQAVPKVVVLPPGSLPVPPQGLDIPPF